MMLIKAVVVINVSIMYDSSIHIILNVIFVHRRMNLLPVLTQQH